MAVSITAWRIGVDAPAYEADDLSGKGAELSGGRWNRPGLRCVYSASSIALAVLETVVHLNGNTLPLNRFLVRISIPIGLWKSRTIFTKDSVPVGWNAVPAGKVSLDLGDAWLKSVDSAVMQVPSVIVPHEYNVLLNPKHPQAAQIKAKKIERWTYDGRLTPGN